MQAEIIAMAGDLLYHPVAQRRRGVGNGQIPTSSRESAPSAAANCVRSFSPNGSALPSSRVQASAANRSQLKWVKVPRLTMKHQRLQPGAAQPVKKILLPRRIAGREHAEARM